MRTLSVVILLAATMVSASAAADEPQLSVSPSTDLSQGQVVEIRGTNSPSLLSWVGLCGIGEDLSSIETAIDQCALLDYRRAGSSEVMSDWIAEPVETTFGGDVLDCRVRGCQVVFVGAVDRSSIPDFVLTQPVVFTTPLAIVSPRIELVDQSPVEVDVSGVDQGADVQIMGCVAGSGVPDDGQPDGCVELAPANGAPGTWLAERWIVDTDGLTADCAVVDCVLGARVVDESGVSGSFAHVSFTAAAETETSVQGQLGEGDIFTVDATNVDKLAHNRTVVVCVVGFPFAHPTPSTCAPTDAIVDDSERSTYSSTVTVPRVIEIEGTAVDCQKTFLCLFFLVGRTGPGDDAPFNMAALVLAGFVQIPDFEVTPFRDLAETQVVDVFVDAASASPAVVGVCRSFSVITSIARARRSCDVMEVGPHAAEFTFAFPVNQAFTADNGSTTCGNFFYCEIVYLSAEDEREVAPVIQRQSLSFARRAGTFPQGTAADGRDVVIALFGYPVGDGITGVPVQCGFGESIDFDHFYCRGGPALTAVDGVYDTTLNVSRFIDRADGDPIDCSQSPTRCLIGMFVWDENGRILATTSTRLRVTS